MKIRTFLPLLSLLPLALTTFACTAPDDESSVAASDEESAALNLGNVGNVGRPPITIAPQLDVAHVTAMQPGWVRVEASFSFIAPDATFELSTSAPADTVTTNLVAIDHSKRRAIFDLKTSLAWLDQDASRLPPQVTSLTVRAKSGATVLAEKTSMRAFRMDVPLSHLTPNRNPFPITADSVALDSNVTAASRRWAAYPPQIIAVQTPSGRTAFMEVEEVRSQQKVRLRHLAGFDRDPKGNDMLAFELGGGGEIPASWGVDVDVRGITKVQGPAEETHAGFSHFATSEWSPLDMNDRTKLVYAAPPLFDDAMYLANVLDNRGVPRVIAPRYAIDVSYNAWAHTLEARNGAKLARVEDARIEGIDPARLTDVTVLPRIVPVPDIAAATGVDVTHASPMALMRTLPGAMLAAKPLSSSTAMTVPRLQVQRGPSPEELSIQASAQKLYGALVNLDGSSCSLSSDKKSIIGTPTQCAGYASASGCPTQADPVRPETLAGAPGMPTYLSLHETLTPQLAGRWNQYGTCALHSQVQHYEAVLNKLYDDLAPTRFVMVDGAPIAVPEPRVALSPAAFLANLATWEGTRDDEDRATTDYAAKSVDEQAQIPMVVESYWPARENETRNWTLNSGVTPIGQVTLAQCRVNFWSSGFCVGQGTAPPGAYRNYASMVDAGGTAADPLRDGMWSEGHTYSHIVSTPIALDDRRAAEQSIIAELRTGLPVRLSMLTVLSAKADDTVGFQLLQGGMSFYLPPEIAGCNLGDSFKLEGGHAMNIVGFVLRGAPETPDPYRSFFIVQNNWGKAAGYNGYFTVNFAAFEKLATDARTYRLDRTCASAACAHH